MIDITVPLAATTPEWPGDTPFSCGWTCRREDPASVNLSCITTSPHVGTHADAPMHVETGWPASESLPLSAFVGTALVIAIPPGYNIAHDLTVSDLQGMIATASGDSAHDTTTAMPARLLLRTGRDLSSGQFPDDWPTLTVDAAQWLVTHGLQLWGTDAPSVDRRSSTTLPVHHVLFSNGAYVLETLALDRVDVGWYELLAQPLLIVGADAAPVRAVLRRD
ncbi:MAG: cyclase family protein [Gemmatimonadaceae bacterium]|nr:cyclase family protein [Gemmatimonadaceae bacterium]